MHKRERHVKLFGTILCEVFAFLTIIYLFADGEADRLALAFGTLLGDSLGVTGRIPNIQSVSVNGLLLPVDGYIDIGLIDTMLDMLLETAGAVVTCVILWLDKGKHPLIQNKQSIEKLKVDVR